ASQKHYCTNPYMRGKDNLDEECKLLLSKGGTGCPEFDNMEDTARDVGSADIEEEALHSTLQATNSAELEGLCEANASVYQRLYEVTQLALTVITCYSWTGDKALRELQEANISQQSFPSLLGFATK
ncbi:hypothetical protein PanWU01x14_032080, partial [Parasponia andersonii]